MTNLIDVLYETSIASINIFIHRTVNTHTSVHIHRVGDGMSPEYSEPLTTVSTGICR